MVKIFAPASLQRISIDFDDKVERTSKGALYLSPGSIKEISDSEWEYIKKYRPIIAKQLKVEIEQKKEIKKEEKIEKLVEEIPKIETLDKDIEIEDTKESKEEVIEQSDTSANEEVNSFFGKRNKKKKKKKF